MKIFMTGGTGFIGSAVIKELVAAGHEVTGLARSEQSKLRLTELGASSYDGSLEDPDSLMRGAQSADAAIHCAFVHNFADFVAAGQVDKQAIEAIGEALSGTDKPFVVTSGVPGGVPGHVVTENDESDSRFPRLSEAAALPFVSRGVDVRIVRPSRFVYSESMANGFIAALIGTAQQKGVSAYVSDGGNHIHVVNVNDLATLYRDALEKGHCGGKYQGVGEGSIIFRDVAEAIGERLNVHTVSLSVDEAAEHFGFLGAVVGADNPASSDITQKELDWNPTNRSFLHDLSGKVSM